MLGCCLLFAGIVRCVLVGVHRVLCFACSLFYDMCFVLRVVCLLIWCVLFVDVLLVVCCLLFVVSCLLFVACCVLLVV